MAEGRIPASKVRAFAIERAGLETEDEVEAFAGLIHAMDNVYLARSETAGATDGARNKVAVNDRRGLIGLLQRLGGGKKAD